MVGHGNKARSLAYRNAVILYLRDAGFTKADSRPELKGLPLKEREANDVGDIVGLPWTLGVRSSQTIDLSGAQDQARAEAGRAGSELFASIQQHRGRAIGESYVTMPLSIFLTVLGDHRGDHAHDHDHGPDHDHADDHGPDHDHADDHNADQQTA